jgi:hypothetical protein
MRQALELALEALQFALHVGFPESSESQIKKGEKAYQQHRAAITAIKEALAQPEEEKLHPVHIGVDVTKEGTAVTAFYRKPDAVMEMFYSQFHPLAQPEQEPVAKLDDLEQEIYENTRQFVSRDVMEWMLKRYYTTPPQRKPLTDVQVRDITKRYALSLAFPYDSKTTPEMFARAIEAAHGIKE